MRDTLYWSFLVLLSILLAYTSPFGLYPLVLLAGALVLSIVYRIAFSRDRRTRVRLFGSVFLYVALYWTIVGFFSNIKEQREFIARYEPYSPAGQPQGYTFYYVDYAGCYERVDSPELNKVLQEKRPDRVRMVLETVKDFGRLRAYTVRSIESIAVDKNWTDGKPPWDALRATK